MGLTTREEDFASASSLHLLTIIFYSLPIKEEYIGSRHTRFRKQRASKGNGNCQFAGIKTGRKVTAVIPVEDFENHFLIAATKQGLIKRPIY